MLCCASQQNTQLASGFGYTERGSLPAQRHRKMLSSSALGRAETTAYVDFGREPSSSRALIFKAKVREALEAGELDRLLPLWRAWVAGGDDHDVPFDGAELRKVRQLAEATARRQLREAVRDGEADAVQQALRTADAVAEHWPHGAQVKMSLEYAAARSHESEDGPRAQQSESGASPITAQDSHEAESGDESQRAA